MQIIFTGVLFPQVKEITLMLMRTFLLLYCTTLFGLNNHSLHSQNQKVVIDVDTTMSVYEVLTLIGNQTNCTFLYQSKLFEGLPKVQLKKGTVKVMKLLKLYLPESKFDIMTDANHFTIRPKTIKNRQQQINGTVKDFNGQPIVGATIQIKESNRGAVSDFDGSFTLLVEPDDILVISALGFQTVEVVVDNQIEINVIMEESITQLETITLNAGYYTVKDKEKTGSIVSISPTSIDKSNNSHPLALLQGRASGVEIIQSSGVPGSGFDIRIRGQNSLRPNGNAPLYVIDGVPFDSQAIGSNFTATIFPNSNNPLNTINLNSIESIEILKDADATAIYGSRGANGVVLINTKKGHLGKTEIQVEASSGFSNVANYMDLLNTEQYLDIRRQAFENDGISEYPFFAYDINGTWDQERNTDWQKQLTGNTANSRNLRTSISGGSETTRFNIGGFYGTQTTVFPGDFKFRKGGANISLNHNSKDDRLNLALTSNYSALDNDQPSFDPTVDSRRLPPNAPSLYDSEGNLNWEDGTWVNPLAAFNGQYESVAKNLISNLSISYELLKGLKLILNMGYTSVDNKELRTAPSTTFNPAFGLGPEYSSVFKSSLNRDSWIIEPQVSYVTKFGNGTIDLLLGSSFQSQSSNQLVEYGFGFTSNRLITNLAAANNTVIASDTEIDYKYQAFFGRINYNIKDRYIINLTARRDGSSRFGPGNQFSNFGSIGVSWIFSEESLFKNSGFLSFGKIRASYGSTGNDQIGDYQFYDTYTTSGSIYQGVNGLSPTRLFNPNFQWETTRKLEAALELGLFNDRLNITTALFRNESSNQLVGIPLPGTTGFQSIQANLDATVQNKGFELSVRSENLSSETITWITDFNISKIKNELVAYPNLESSTYSQQYRVGYPLNINLAYKLTGVNPQTGLYEFEDVNEDGQITFPDDRQTVVDLSPDFFGGLSNSIDYKKWNLNFLFQFVKQKRQAFTLGNSGLMNNQSTEILNSWIAEGDIAEFQKFTAGYNSEALRTQSFFESSTGNVVDASFVRLKSLSLSYDLDLDTALSLCKIYLTGQNLLTFTPYQYGDPEFNSIGFLPPLRTISGGVQLTF